MKKIIAIIISVIMIMGIMPVTSFAAAQEIALVQIGDIATPVVGAHPDYIATYGNGYNFTTELDGYGTSYGVSWIDVTAGNKVMTAADVFEAGHVYKVSVLVKAASGYSFKTINNYITSVAVKINGLDASVYLPTGLYAFEYVGITYTFAACDYTRISSVAVTDLEIPASGEKLDFTPAAKDDSYIATMISWRDVTANKSVTEGTTAIAGHKYEVEIWLRAAEGYRFKVDGEGYPAITAKIGAYNATVIDSTSDGVVVGIKDSYIVPDDIASVTVSGIDAPVAGAAVDTDASCGSGYQITKIVWVDTTGEYKDRIYDIKEFEAGRKYTVQVYLETISNYRFSTDYDGVTDVAAKINGENAILYSDYSTTTAVIGFEFPATEAAPPTVIDTVYVNGIDAPEYGKAPDMEGTCGEGYEITKVLWVDSTGNYKDYVYGITEFETGHKYTVQITLNVKDGYEFSSDGYYNDVVGEINMEPAIEYGTDSLTEVTIGYEFPAVEAITINEVQVDNIDAPVAGATADAEAGCGSDDYYISEIAWVDTTGEHKDWIFDIEGFDYGREYTVQITLRAEPGFRFETDDDGVTDVTGKINGKDAIVYSDYSDTTVTIGYKFPATEKKPDTVISTVVVDSVDAPVAGAAADMEAVCTEDGYEIVKIVWVDSTDNYESWVYGVEKFEAGRKYTVQISLVPKDGYKFLEIDGYNETKAVINGKAAIAYGSHSDSELTIGFVFDKLPEEHKHEYKAVVTEPTCTEKGFTTYTCECGDTYKGDETATVAHTPEIIKGKPATTTEEGFTDGEKCSVCGKILKAQEIIPVIIAPDPEFLPGDVNKDGKITATDARLALRIAAKLDAADEYTEKAADIDENGKITSADARKILRIAAKID